MDLRSRTTPGLLKKLFGNLRIWQDKHQWASFAELTLARYQFVTRLSGTFQLAAIQTI